MYVCVLLWCVCVCVCEQGRYQINDTHLHFPVKSSVKQHAQTWYTKKVIKYTEMRERKEKPISDELYWQAMRSLLRVPQLRSKAPEWLQNSMHAITKPSQEDEGRNLIAKGWKELYLDPIQKEGMLEEARTYHTEQVEARKARQLVEAVRSASGGQAHEAVAAILSQAEPEVDMSLPEEVRDVVRVEGAWHEAAVPVVRGGKKEVKARPGTSVKTLQKRLAQEEARDLLLEVCVCNKFDLLCMEHTHTHTHARTLYEQQQDSSDDDGEGLAGRMEEKKRKKQDKVAVSKKTKFSQLDPTTWKVVFAEVWW